jgi:UDP-glucose 6-dehydrogenase
VNENQKLVIVDKVISQFGKDLKGMTFAIWGMSFKPNTDDMREAPALVIVERLISLGAKIKAFDPVAMQEARNHYLGEKVDFKWGFLSAGVGMLNNITTGSTIVTTPRSANLVRRVNAGPGSTA